MVVEVTEEDRLLRKISQARGALNSLQGSKTQIAEQRVDWPQLLDLFFNETPPGGSVTSFRQNGDEVSLSARAKEHRQIFDYRDILTTSPYVEQVTNERSSKH